MTLLHPSRTGTPVTVWFVDGAPVRLLSGGARFTVLGDPRCADINGERYWRVRARGADGRGGLFDLRQTDDGWVLAGMNEDPARPDDR